MAYNAYMDKNIQTNVNYKHFDILDVLHKSIYKCVLKTLCAQSDIYRYYYMTFS